MRSRWAILAAGLLFMFIAAPPAFAGGAVAQAEQDDAETQGEDPGSDGGEGQSDAEAETGAEEGNTAEAEVEAGPPWTYQMARIILVLSILLGLAIARWYWKLVGSRQRAA